MAKGKKTGGRDFKPGDARAGRPRIPDDIKQIKSLTRNSFIEIANKFLNMTREEISKALQSPDVSMLDMMVGGIIAKAAKDSDTGRAAFILDRIVSRLKLQDEFDVLSSGGSEIEEQRKEEENAGPTFVVEINDRGKFVRPRPRIVGPHVGGPEIKKAGG